MPSAQSSELSDPPTFARLPPAELLDCAGGRVDDFPAGGAQESIITSRHDARGISVDATLGNPV